MLDEVGFDEFEGENNRAGFTAGGGAVGGFGIKFKNIIISVNTKTGVAENLVAREILLQGIKVRLLGFILNFTLVDNVDLVGVFGDRLVGGGESGIDLINQSLASLIESDAVFSE